MFVKKSHRAVILSIMMLLALSFIVGCESSSPPEENPPGTTNLTVTASPAAVETGVQSVIVVNISNAGEGHTVTFEVQPSSAGTLSSSTATTDVDGEAAAILIPSIAGAITVQVTADVNGTIYTSSVGVIATQASTGGGGTANISVNATPSLLPASGADTAIVTVLVTDADGNAAPTGTIVYLSAGEKFDDLDNNGYFTNGVDTVIYDAIDNDTWDAIGVIPATSTLNGSGVAVVNYVSGTVAGNTYIKATVIDGAFAGSSDANITLTPDANIASFELHTDDIHLGVKSTGQKEVTMLRATGYDAFGNVVPEGIEVSFIITDGPDNTVDGEHLADLVDPNRRGPYVAVTNAQGIASCPISSGTVSGTIRTRAYVGSVLSNSTLVMVHAGPPARIELGADLCNIPAWEWVNKQNEVTAIVSDIYNNPCRDETVVYFTVDEGVIKAHEAIISGENGLASTIWMSNGPDAAFDGIVCVTAETAGGTVSTTECFINSGIPVTLIASGVPASLPADGKSIATFVVSGYDVNGNFVVGGTNFDADASFVSITSGTLEDGCNDSSDRVKATSTTLEEDLSMTGGNDNGIGAVETIELWVGATAYTTVTIQLATGNAYTENCSFDGPENATQGEALRFTVVIKDRFGNPLGDHTLNMTATTGVVTGASQETNKYGEATGFVWTAPAVAGPVTITVSDIDPMGGVFLSKTITVQ